MAGKWRQVNQTVAIIQSGVQCHRIKPEKGCGLEARAPLSSLIPIFAIVGIFRMFWIVGIFRGRLDQLIRLFSSVFGCFRLSIASLQQVKQF